MVTPESKSQGGDSPDSRALQQIAEQWLEAIRQAVYMQTVTSRSETPITTEEEIPKLRKRWLPEFDFAYARCLKNAQILGTLPQALSLLEGIRSAITEFERESSADAFQSYMDHKRRGGSGLPWLNAQARAEWFAEAFTRLAPLVDHVPEEVNSPAHTLALPGILTDRQLQVWNALSGVARTAKEIAKDLGAGMTELNVRRVILEIRKSDPKRIVTVRGRGYYRPDKPPPDAQR